MNIGEILVWESTNVLLLIPVVIALVMLVRGYEGGRFSRKGIGCFCSAIRVRKFSHFTCG